MHQRAEALSAAGHHMAAFVQLRHIGETFPTFPGLQPALQRAGAAVATQQAAAAHTRAAAPPLRTYVRTNRRSGRARQAPGAGQQQQQSQEHAHYAALGLQPGASLAEVRASFRRLALQLHPDKAASSASVEACAEAEERFKRVSAAHAAIVAASEHDA
jgi:selenocysteine lyase/cysteine desulfurase